jgi:hypothetical protein
MMLQNKGIFVLELLSMKAQGVLKSKDNFYHIDMSCASGSFLVKTFMQSFIVVITVNSCHFFVCIVGGLKI